jgi:hypothetical protein
MTAILNATNNDWYDDRILIIADERMRVRKVEQKRRYRQTLAARNALQAKRARLTWERAFWFSK